MKLLPFPIRQKMFCLILTSVIKVNLNMIVSKIQFNKYFAKQLVLFEATLIGKNGLYIRPKIQRIFNIYQGEKCLTRIY